MPDPMVLAASLNCPWQPSSFDHFCTVVTMIPCPINWTQCLTAIRSSTQKLFLIGSRPTRIQTMDLSFRKKFEFYQIALPSEQTRHFFFHDLYFSFSPYDYVVHRTEHTFLICTLFYFFKLVPLINLCLVGVFSQFACIVCSTTLTT